MFCYYLLGGNTVALSGLHGRLCHTFLVKNVLLFTEQLLLCLTFNCNITLMLSQNII